MGANTNTTASTELAKLDEQRIRAAGHVEEPEGEQAPAARAVREAAAALAEARQAVADPALVARLEGARARIRDVHEERQRFVAAHLRELIADPEADAQAAMADMLTPCEQLVQAFDQREQAAGRISALATKAARPSPGDVGPPSRADVATREVTRLLDLSEPAPTLRHYPSQPEHRHVPPGGGASVTADQKPCTAGRPRWSRTERGQRRSTAGAWPRSSPPARLARRSADGSASMTDRLPGELGVSASRKPAENKSHRHGAIGNHSPFVHRLAWSNR